MMARGVPRRGRHHGHADALGFVVKAEPAREEAVAEGDVEQVTAARACGRQRACHPLAPDVEVAGGVRRHSRLAPGAGGSVDPDDLAARHGQETEGIVVAKVGLVDERQARELRDLADRDRAEPLTVERHTRDRPAQGLLHPLELKALAWLARHGLGLDVPDHSRGSSNPCSRRSRPISSRINRSATWGTSSRAISRTIRSIASRTSSAPNRASIASAASRVAPSSVSSRGGASAGTRRIASSSASAPCGSSSNAPSTVMPAGGPCPRRKRKNTGSWWKRGALLRLRTTSTPETPTPGSSGSIRITPTSWSRTARRTPKLEVTVMTSQPARRSDGSSSVRLAGAPSAMRTHGGRELTSAGAASRQGVGAARETPGPRSGGGGAPPPPAGSGAPRAPGPHEPVRSRTRRGAEPAPRDRWRRRASGRWSRRGPAPPRAARRPVRGPRPFPTRY